MNSSWVINLARRMFQGGLAHAVRTAAALVDGKLRMLVEHAAERLRKMAVSYAAAAAFAVAALVSLSGAAANGLTTLGLPAWASHLILSGLSALIAWIFYTRARSRKVSGKSARDSEGEPEEQGPGFTVNIVSPARGAARRKRDRRQKARKRRTVRVTAEVPKIARPSRASAKRKKKNRKSITQRKELKHAPARKKHVAKRDRATLRKGLKSHSPRAA